MKPFAEKNLDLLQNLEYGIVEVYRARPTLLDANAQDAVEVLARHYHAEEEGRTPPACNLSEPAELVFRTVQEFAEWRLGRAALRRRADPFDHPAPVSDLVRALREIGKSIPRWTRQSGRRGYLDFVTQYLP